MVIVRVRQQGKKRYYYLEHSIRKGNKVVKKERYLGTKLPKNLEEIKQEFLQELQADLYKKFAALLVVPYGNMTFLPNLVLSKILI